MGDSPTGQAGNRVSSSRTGQLTRGDDDGLDEAQRLAGVASRGSRARPPRRRSRAENVRRHMDDRRHDGRSDESGDDNEDPYADADVEENEDRRRMPPPEPRRRAVAPAPASPWPARGSDLTKPVATSQQHNVHSESPPEGAPNLVSEVQGGPGAVAAAAMELRRAYRSGRERKKRNAWEGAVTAFGEALKLYQAAVDSGADSGGGIALGGGFSSSVRVLTIAITPPIRFTLAVLFLSYELVIQSAGVRRSRRWCVNARSNLQPASPVLRKAQTVRP